MTDKPIVSGTARGQVGGQRCALFAVQVGKKGQLVAY